MIDINKYYLFTFTQKFAALDGVYQVTKTMSFETALTDENVNFVTTLYAAVGLTQADFNADYTAYQGQEVWELQTPGPSPTTYYVPVPIAATLPDPTVTEYRNIYLSILIGPFADTASYSWIKGQVNDIVSSVTGNTNSAQWFANPSQNVWLTETQYAALSATRQANIKAIAPLTTVNQTNQAAIDALKTQISVLESIIISMQPTASS